MADDNLPIRQWQMADLVTSWMAYVTSPIEKDVLLFVYARTYSFRKISDWISEAQFLGGIPGVLAPLNMTRSSLYKAISGLQNKEILHKKVVKGKTFYSINSEWNLLKYIPEGLIVCPSPRTGESVTTDTTVRELTIRELHHARVRTHDGVGANVMSLMDNVKAAAAAATEKQLAARAKNKMKLNATALCKIWDDAFRETYPDEILFAWAVKDQANFHRAVKRGIPVAETERFVTFCVTDYANVITTHFAWMKGLPDTPRPAFVSQRIETFYQEFRNTNDPNRKLRSKIKAQPEPEQASAKSPGADNQKLAEENKILKRKLAALSAKTANERKLRIKGYIKNGTAQTTPVEDAAPIFRKWD